MTAASEYEVRLIHDGGPTTLFYQHHPLDVEGWRGDNFPFTFNIADYNVVTSDSVHLPPTVHLFMEATGVYVMNFLPKPAESVAGNRAHALVPPQRRLRRDRVLPRRLALRHPDARRFGFPAPQGFTTALRKRHANGRAASSTTTTRWTGR